MVAIVDLVQLVNFSQFPAGGCFVASLLAMTAPLGVIASEAKQSRWPALSSRRRGGCRIKLAQTGFHDLAGRGMRQLVDDQHVVGQHPAREALAQKRNEGVAL